MKEENRDKMMRPWRRERRRVGGGKAQTGGRKTHPGKRKKKTKTIKLKVRDAKNKEGKE